MSDTYYGITICEWVILVVIISSCILYLVIQTRAPNLENYIKDNSSVLRYSILNNDLVLKNAGSSDISLLEVVGNGDLIFFCGDTPGERTCRWCTNTMFSHVGMLFKEINPEGGNEVIYIWESDLGQKTKDGPRLIRLDDKLKRYHGQPYFMWRKLKSNNPSTENIMKVVEKYKSYEFDNKMLSWWVSYPFLSFIHDIVKDEQKLFCSELIALTMQSEHINMLHTENDKKYPASSYSPKDFAEFGVKGMKNSFLYGAQNFVDFSAFKKPK
jgi:hypothetical protein